MSRVLHQNIDIGKGITLTQNSDPVALFYNEGQPNVVRFLDGGEALSSCLRCHDVPCMRLSPDETVVSNFPDFPADRTDEVCAAHAINREGDRGAPIIDASKCFFCGVCVARCPVGAIRLIPDQGAIIEDNPNDRFIETPDHPEARMRATRELFSKVERHGTILVESDSFIDELEKRLAVSYKTVGDRFPNLLARNLFLTVGISAAMRRKGNNTMRMDLILGPPGVKQGVTEVEFGDEAILDAPRDVMDAIAVLVSRHGWIKPEVVAAVVGDVMPNRRSEYWRIIQDVDRVLGVRIGTISILTLMLAVWNRIRLHLDPKNGFYVDCNTDSYRTQVIETMLGRSLRLSPLPRSLVETAK